MVLVHEVKFLHPESGRVVFLGRREAKNGKVLYTLKMGGIKGIIYHSEKLHPDIEKVLGDAEPYGQRRGKVGISTRCGMFNYYPAVKVPNGKGYYVSQRADGIKQITIPVSDDEIAMLERITWNSRVRQGIRAFFDRHGGRRISGFDRALMKEHKREISRTLLLVLDRYRTGEGRKKKYTAEHIGNLIDFQAEGAVMEALAKVDAGVLPKIVEALNSDDTMRMMMRKHRIPPFSVEDLERIKGIAEGMQ